MKTSFLAFLCMALFPISNVFAQPCNLSNIEFENVYTAADRKCYTDVSFDMAQNNGNKYIYLHFWTTANFSKVDKTQFSTGFGPANADINGTAANPHPALATVALNNNDGDAPVWNVSNYRPDATVSTVKGSRIEVSTLPVGSIGSDPLYRYTLKAVPLGVLGGNCSAAAIAVAIWSTQSNAANSKIHCSLTGPTAKQVLTINGSVPCGKTKYTLTVTNKTDKVLSGNADLFTNKDNQPTNGHFAVIPESKFDSITYFLIEPGQSLTFSRTIPDTCRSYNLFAMINYGGQYRQVAELLASSCSTLPVVMQSVSATRTKGQVAVKWQTASEQDVRGFNIFRQGTESGWKVIGFLPSQAAGGNSSQLLSYLFTDVNPVTGTSQYRIQEIGNSGKSTLSEVRIVRSEESPATLTIYPNPATSGRAVVVFDKTSLKDVIVTDVNGRIVRQLKGITTNNLVIDQLVDGLYQVQVIDRTTNEQTVARFIVKK